MTNAPEMTSVSPLSRIKNKQVFSSAGHHRLFHTQYDNSKSFTDLLPDSIISLPMASHHHKPEASLFHKHVSGTAPGEGKMPVDTHTLLVPEGLLPLANP